jgi:hypothetical protein
MDFLLNRSSVAPTLSRRDEIEAWSAANDSPQYSQAVKPARLTIYRFKLGLGGLTVKPAPW